MSYQLNLDSLVDASTSVPKHTQRDAFMHLVEEVGELSVNINRPEKAGECLAGEVADVLNCAIDIYILEYGTDLSFLQEQLDKKCLKWKTQALRKAI